MYVLQSYLMNPVGRDHIVLLQDEEWNTVSVCFSESKSDLNILNCSSVHLSFVTKCIGIVGERR